MQIGEVGVSEVVDGEILFGAGAAECDRTEVGGVTVADLGAAGVRDVDCRIDDHRGAATASGKRDFEGVFIGLISWSAALLVSFPISFLLLKIISEAMINAPIPLAFTLDGFLIWLGVVLALSVFASILPARSAARLTIREVLAYE